MRQINDRLHRPFKEDVFNLIQKQGEDHGHHHVEHQLSHGDHDGIDEDLPHILHLKHVFKIFKSHKLRAKDSQTRIIILKSHDHAEHRHDIDGQHPHKRRHYDYCSRKEINHKHAYELQEEKYITDNASLEKLKADWLSLNWVHENGLFDQFRLDLKNSRLTVPRLYHLLFALENVWNASYSELTGQTLTLPASFLNWREVEDWLTDVYQKTNLFSSSTRYSREVTQNILAVKTYIDGHCGEQR